VIIVKWSVIFISLVIVSCGYHLRNSENPFYEYRVKTVAVPMFINQTPLPNVAGPLTEKISQVLMGHRGLKIYPGEYGEADAILVGIITSDDHQSQLLRNTGKSFTSDALAETIKPRQEFYVPTTITYNLKLRVILIKRPAPAELELLVSEMGKELRGPKVIFNQELLLTGSYSQKISENINSDSSGVVNFTKNKAIQEKSIQNLSDVAAEDFKQMVLNVF